MPRRVINKINKAPNTENSDLDNGRRHAGIASGSGMEPICPGPGSRTRVQAGHAPVVFYVTEAMQRCPNVGPRRICHDQCPKEDLPGRVARQARTLRRGLLCQSGVR